MGKFNNLFKIPIATPEYLRKVESLIINHLTEDSLKSEILQAKYKNDPPDFNKDSDREAIVCRNLCLLKENYSHQQPFFFKDLNLDRDLSPIIIYKIIQDDFKFLEEVSELKLAFETKNLDLFFKLWLTNQYSVKLVPNSVVHLKNDWSREFFGVKDKTYLKKYQTIDKSNDIQEILKIMENTPVKIVNEDIPKKDLIPSMDILREFYLVESLANFHRNKDEIIVPKRWVFNYHQNRDLDLKEVRKKIELLFGIDESAVKLKKSLSRNKLKEFFIYFIKNNYLIESIPSDSLMSKRWIIRLNQKYEETL